ncbi:MAG: MerR family transcriptional regulator [Rikenellaceae bacterium]|nr:MerR family transcriptional regulator [Rikenellaceae bacterium]
MGEVAEMFDVNPSLIRFWESKFDILRPHKSRHGKRLFTPRDIDNLKLVYHLVKEKGMTLAGAQKRIKENPEGISRDMEITDRLLRVRALLMEIRQELKSGGPEEEVYRNGQIIEENVETTVEVAVKMEETIPKDAAAEQQAVHIEDKPRIIEQTLF